MDEIAKDITSRLLDLVNALYPVGAIHPLGVFTRNEYVTALIILLIALVMGGMIRYVLRRRSSISSKVESTAKVPHHLIVSVSRPLYLVIALYAVYFAAMPFFLSFRGNPGADSVRGAIGSLFNLAALIALLRFVLRLTSAVEMRLMTWAAGTSSRLDDLLVPLLSSSLRIVLVVVAVTTAIGLFDLPERYDGPLSKITDIVFIVAVASIGVRFVRVGQQMILSRYDIAVADNLQARKVYTQLHVIGRVIYFVIAVVSAAAILMLFDRVRNIGTSLLESAGIAGIIVGFAAQKTLANIFAGFQIALAQPMREDDVVIVEGEWGRIEEITLSYVVVHIWDDRRLIVPLSYFIEKPFQNWTRTSADILGTVMMYVDYTCDVEAVRKALKGIVESHPLWDGRFGTLQVTDAKERTIELRVLATSGNASKSFDLRCAIREQLIAYLQQSQTRWLPRERVDVLSLNELQTANASGSCGGRQVRRGQPSRQPRVDLKRGISIGVRSR